MSASTKTRIAGMFAAALVLAVLGGAGQAADAPFPNKPIRIIVPVAAGGFQDVISRSFAQRMTTTLGQPFIIDNRASNGSIVGTQLAAKAPADGYTLLAVTNTFSISPGLIKDAGYDPVKDFVGIGIMVRSPLFMVTGMTTGINTVADLVRMAKAKPGLPFASGGTGSTSHIPAEIFNGQAGVSMVHVPYKGNAPAMPDVIAGRVMYILNPVIASIGLIKGNQIKAIAITSEKRSALFPNVPSLAELGYPEYDIALYAALIAPAGTPAPVLERLNVAMNAAKNDPDLKKQMDDSGQELPAMESVANFNKFLQGEAARYLKEIRERGIKDE